MLTIKKFNRGLCAGIVVCVLNLSFITSVLAQLLVDETVQLNNRTAEEVIPRLQPYLHAEGILAGDGREIYIKTTPANLDDIKRLLKQIDAGTRRLRIAVSMDPRIVQQSKRSSTVTTKTAPRDRPRGYFVESVEGQWARVNVSTRYPVRERFRTERGTVTERVIYRGIVAGFEVLPVVDGDTVTLKVRAVHAVKNSERVQAMDVSEVETVAQGKLGQWINLGGATDRLEQDEQGNVISTGNRSGLSDNMAIKVDIVEPAAVEDQTQ